MTCWVYVAKGVGTKGVDENGDPYWDEVFLYIGSTGDIGRRLREHEKSAEWWSHVTTMELQSCEDDRAMAYRTEKFMIGVYRPLYNKTDGGQW